jgi:hypothetical protein
MVRRLLNTVSMLLLVSGFAYPSFALAYQDAPPTPAPVEGVSSVPVADPEGAGSALLETFLKQIELFTTMALTLALVQILKFLPPLRDVPAQTITIVVGTLLWLGSAAAQWAGVLEQYNSALDLLGRAAPLLGQLILIVLGASGLFKVAKATDFPLLSASRT